jgi:hypothetical protein
MVSKRRKKIRLTVVAAAVAALGVFAYVVPASNVAPASNVDRASLADRPGTANNATITPWSNYLSERAVDSGGIENDLDGNASALVPSDQLR